MAFLLAAILVLAPFVVLYLAGDPPAWALQQHRSPGNTRCDDPPVVPLTADEAARCEVESLLAQRLMKGEIGRVAYHDAMAELALRDARSRPLLVPGDPA
jgi:hypothetical protein